MDIYCKKCGEPWDMDTLHDEVGERIASGEFSPLPPNGEYRPGPEYTAYRQAYDRLYQIVRADFYREGCRGLHAFTGGNTSWCIDRQTNTTAAMSAMIDLMGDDLDGIASMMDELALD